jgi:hypothetical protein
MLLGPTGLFLRRATPPFSMRIRSVTSCRAMRAMGRSPKRWTSQLSTTLATAVSVARCRGWAPTPRRSDASPCPDTPRGPLLPLRGSSPGKDPSGGTSKTRVGGASSPRQAVVRPAGRNRRRVNPPAASRGPKPSAAHGIPWGAPPTYPRPFPAPGAPPDRTSPATHQRATFRRSKVAPVHKRQRLDCLRLHGIRLLDLPDDPDDQVMRVDVNLR